MPRITKEQALKILSNATFSEEWQGNEELTTAYYMAMEALENDWTPVRKRLPKDDTEVLVTVFFIGLDRKLSNGMTEHYKPNTYVEIASQIDGEWSSESDEDKIAPARHIVTAWMPLPKPYKDGIQPILTEKIIFCKDCKHFSDGDCTELPKIVSENDFCSFGERKESGENENHY